MNITPSQPGLPTLVRIAAIIVTRFTDDYEACCVRFDEEGASAGVYVFPKQTDEETMSKQMDMITDDPMPPLALGAIILGPDRFAILCHVTADDRETQHIRNVVSKVFSDLGIGSTMTFPTPGSAYSVN